MSKIKFEQCCGERDDSLITEPIRRRLPAYYRALIDLYSEGKEKVNAKQLATLVGACETQVKTDLTAIGCKGQPGYGYSIARLYRRIGEVMNIHDKYSAVIVGNGAFAEAVSQSHLFTKRGIKLEGRFSNIDACAEGDASNLGFEEFCKRYSVDIIIMACDAAQAKECLTIAQSVGVKGVMNFSEAELTSDVITVRNLHIDDTLMMLCSEI